MLTTKLFPLALIGTIAIGIAAGICGIDKELFITIIFLTFIAFIFHIFNYTITGSKESLHIFSDLIKTITPQCGR